MQKKSTELSSDESELAKPIRTVLLVDDKSIILETLTILLIRRGYCVLQASEAQQAFSLLKTHPVGVILSDYSMPGMNGIELLRQVEECYPSIVRMLMSASLELAHVSRGVYHELIYKFIPKPWNNVELLADVEAAFNEYEHTSVP